MKDYPDFKTGHEAIWISQETRRAAVKRFYELWSPILKDNGFLRAGSCWWRVYGGQILQGIQFDPRPQAKYVDNLEVRYYMWPLFAEQCGMPPATFLYPQQHLTDYVYPGWPTGQRQSRFIPFSDAGERMSEKDAIEYTCTEYCTFFNALHSVESALEAELELFRERTLPVLNQIKDEFSYAEKELALRSPALRHCITFLSPAGVDILLALHEWKMAERSLRSCLRMEEKIGKTGTTRKCFFDWYANVLEHVLQQDEEWLTSHFHENIVNNWNTIEHWNPRLYKSFYTEK